MAEATAKLTQNDLFGADPEPFGPAERAEFQKLAGGPDMVRVSPSSWAWRPAKPGSVPKYGRCQWIPNGDGTYRPAPQHTRFVIVSREVLDEIGFRGMTRSVSDTTLRRLSMAEEILMFHISPRVRVLDLDSWWRYMDECIADPDKWEEGGESWKNYMFRNALGAHRNKGSGQ